MKDLAEVIKTITAFIGNITQSLYIEHIMLVLNGLTALCNQGHIVYQIIKTNVISGKILCDLELPENDATMPHNSTHNSFGNSLDL